MANANESSADTRSAPAGLVASTAEKYRHALSRGWWLIALGFAVGAVAALLVSFAQTRIYESTATLYVTSGTSSNEATTAYQGSLASQQRTVSYAGLVTSDEIVQRAIKASGLTIPEAEARKSLSATALPETVLLSIHARNQQSDTAARLASGAATAMVDYVQTLETPADGGQPLAKVTVVTPATKPATLVSPKIGTNVAAGSLVGALVGLIILLLRERFNTVVRDEESVLQLINPVLALIPESREVSSGLVPDFTGGANPAAESFRRLRTNLAFVNVDSPPRKIIVTSTQAAEGKTTSSVNLAIAFAEAGRRSIIVSADLRRPAIEGRLGISRQVGLTNVLRGDVLPAEVIQRTRYENLDVLPSGEIPPNPAELLGTKRMGQCLDDLAQIYDYVIIDSPPTLPVTDPAVLAQWTDGAIVVVRAGKTTLSNLSSAVEQLTAVHAPILGVVINFAQVGRRAEAYAYYGVAEKVSKNAASTDSEFDGRRQETKVAPKIE